MLDMGPQPKLLEQTNSKHRAVLRTRNDRLSLAASLILYAL